MGYIDFRMQGFYLRERVFGKLRRYDVEPAPTLRQPVPGSKNLGWIDAVCCPGAVFIFWRQRSHARNGR